VVTAIQEAQAPAGYHWEWVPDRGWQPTFIGQCRFVGTKQHVRCQNRAVAKTLRGLHWWAYCAEHMYGRRLEDGKVLVRRLVKNEIGALGNEG
jgi:hypothetical protein